MATVTLDSNNLDAIIADATGQEPPQAEEIKPEVKVEAEVNTEESHDDEVEDDEGLTKKQREEWTKAMQKTIGKKHREKKEAEEFAEAQYREKLAAERRAAELERELNEIKKTTQPKQEEAKKPVRADFTDDEQYIEALANFTADQKLKEYKATLELQTAQQTARSRLDAARALVEDFDSVVTDDVVFPAEVGRYLQKSPMLAEIAYHLAKHPKELNTLASLEPALQLVAVGKIEAKLKPFGKAETSESPKEILATRTTTTNKESSDNETANTQRNPVSRSAPVINPVSSAGGSSDPDPSDMNTRQVIQSWQKKNQANLNQRKRH